MSYADFTRLYGTTARAKFWCDYMAGLKVSISCTGILAPLAKFMAKI